MNTDKKLKGFQLSTCTMRRQRNGFGDASNEKQFQFSNKTEALVALEVFKNENPSCDVVREGSVTVCYHQDAVIHQHEFSDVEDFSNFMAGRGSHHGEEKQQESWNNCASDF